MIIVHTHHTAWPVLGGVERAIQKISIELVKMGHEVHIITSTYGARNKSSYEEINGVYIHRVKSWTPYYPDLTIPRKIPRDILKKADIIHGWSQNSYFTYRICKEAKELDKPIIMYFLGIDYLRYHYNPLIRLFGYPYQKWITWRVVMITDLALVTNEYEKKLLKERYGIDSIVLPHGVDEIYLKLPNMAEHFRRKYGIEGKIIAYIGRIHPTKGLDLLIKAFAKISRQMSDVVLVIAGKGDEKFLRKCLKLVEKPSMIDKVKYIGYISEEDKIAFIDASNIVVLPTRHAGESYPLIIDEVLARDKPIVITEDKTITDRIKGYQQCFIVTPDINKLAETIIALLNSRVGASSSKSAILTWSTIAEILLNTYKKILQSKR